MTRSRQFWAYSAIAAVCVALGGGTANASFTISNSRISLEVNDGGSIKDVTKNVGGFWDYGYPTIGFGISTSNGFALSDQNVGRDDFAGITSLAGDVITTIGAFGNLSFSRTYSLNENNVNISTVITNNGTDEEAFKFFDSGDPDQGIPRGGGFNSFNDVNGQYAIATNSTGTPPDLVKWSTLDTSAVLTFLAGSLDITSSSYLDSVYGNPYDPNFADEDIGMAIIWSKILRGGESIELSYVQSYGTLDETGLAVPEPGSMSLMCLGLCGMAWRSRRNRKSAV